MTDKTETLGLKPCPFCGCAAFFVTSWLPGTPIYSVTCDGESDCMGQNMEQDEQGGFTCEGSLEYVTGKWNTRADLSDAKDKRIDELEAALSDAADALDLANSLLRQKPVSYPIPLTNQFNARHAAAERARATITELQGTDQ